MPPPTDLNVAVGKLMINLEDFARIARQKEERCAHLERDNEQLRAQHASLNHRSSRYVDMEKENMSLRAQNASLNQRISRCSELERENVSLRSQLETLRRHPSGHGPCVPTTDYKSIFDNLSTHKTRLKALQTKYDALEANHAKCQPYIDDAMKKYNAAKESVRQWSVYIERKKHPAPQPTSDAPAPGMSTPAALPRLDDTTVGADDTPRATHVGASTKSVKLADPAESVPTTPLGVRTTTSLPAERPPLLRSEEQQSSSDNSIRITSSQTTDAESGANCNSPSGVEHCASSDSEPTVVSSRPVKRRRSITDQGMPPPVRIKQEPNSAHGAIWVPSGGPEEAIRRIPRHETSDLDACTTSFKTPNKNKRPHLEHQRASSEELPQAPTILANVSFRSEGGLDQQKDSDEQVHVQAEPKTNLGHLRGSQDGILSPLSVNIPTKTKTRQMTGESKRDRDDSAARIGILSEDGDLASSQSGVTTKNENSKEVCTKTPGSERLLNLLEEPIPENNVVLKRRAIRTIYQQPKKPQTPSSNQHPGSRALSPIRGTEKPRKLPITPLSTRPGTANRVRPPPSNNPTAQKKSHRPLSRPTSTSPPPPRPEEEPLRLRPIESLNLEDFKVNPKYMNSEFAFAGTLRRRDDRRCMSGCTKPECCGNAFLKAVQIGGLPSNLTGANSTTANNDSNDPGSNQPDAVVLDAYLGPEWEQIIGSYTADKRRDLLMQARASYFGQQFGKHRQAFERRSTPPGFWRTDMPTTQEELEDRAKAQEMVRAKVQERHREAVKDGGRWLFRDE